MGGGADPRSLHPSEESRDANNQPRARQSEPEPGSGAAVRRAVASVSPTVTMWRDGLINLPAAGVVCGDVIDLSSHGLPPRARSARDATLLRPAQLTTRRGSIATESCAEAQTMVAIWPISARIGPNLVVTCARRKSDCATSWSLALDSPDPALVGQALAGARLPHG